MNQEAGLRIGDTAPQFDLPDTDGARHGLPASGQAPATVVIWTCNHCPYALAWHERLMEVALDYAGSGVVFYAINSNDAERYPADSLEAMRERVSAGEFEMPYLHDAEQTAARAWGARTTPDVFVLDGELRLSYRGAPDSDHQEPRAGAVWLRSALDALLADRPPEPAETEPVGCSIKWRERG